MKRAAPDEPAGDSEGWTANVHPGQVDLAQNERHVMQKRQLEINFTAPVTMRPPIRRHQRMTRARWWFERMRQVADQAWDWSSGPPAPPEQIGLDLAPSRGKA
jgi:hypothetical protein